MQPSPTESREDAHGVIPYTGGPKLNLYSIEKELAELLELRAQAEEESALPEELAAIDNQIAEYFKREVKKVDGTCQAVRIFTDAACIAETEAARLAARAKTLRAQAERIKANALYAMQAHGVTKLETPTHTLRVQANGGLAPLVIDDPQLIPAGLRNTTVTVPGDAYLWLLAFIEQNCPVPHPSLALAFKNHSENPDGSRIRETLKREAVPGARIGERGVHLRVA